jgi:hypothetical protein
VTAAAIEVEGLFELVWIAPLAAVAVTASFATCVLGATRSTDARREGNTGRATAWMGLALLAAVLVLAGVAAGIGVIVAG